MGQLQPWRKHKEEILEDPVPQADELPLGDSDQEVLARQLKELKAYKKEIQKMKPQKTAKNRYQTLLYSNKQDMEIVCRGLDGKRSTYSPTVEGLTLISLPQEKYCTATTSHHSWRASPFMEEVLESKTIPAPFNERDIFGEEPHNIQVMQEVLETMDLDGKTIDDATTALGMVTFQHNSWRWYLDIWQLAFHQL